MANQSDLRVIRSRKMIKQAFLDLIEDRGHEDITITDISARAMVNRKTFYSHFKSKKALFDELVNDHLSLMISNTYIEKLTVDDSISDEDLHNDIKKILHNISGHKRSFRILFNDNSCYELAINELNRRIGLLVHGALVDKALDHSKKSSALPRELFAQSIACLMMLIIKWWINQEAYTAENAADMLFRMFSQGLYEALCYPVIK